MTEREEGKLPFLDLPYQDQSVEQVLALAKEYEDGIDDLVVLGIGGSALGTIALNNPPSASRSTSTVGFPLESNTSLAWTDSISTSTTTVCI